MVTFSYPDAPTPVFAALAPELRKGETIGQSEPSGTGKPSLVHLLTDLLEPAGRILIGDAVVGIDTLRAWRPDLSTPRGIRTS